MAEGQNGSKTSFDILNEAGYRLDKDPWFLSVGITMKDYATHVANTAEHERQDVSDFIKRDDIILEMMLTDTGCYDDVVNIIRKYAGVE